MKWIVGVTVVSTMLSGVTKEAMAEDSFADTANSMPAAIHSTRLDYSKFDSPEAVTVITSEDIRNAGYLDVPEIFRSVAGFRIVKIGVESRVSYHGTSDRENRRMRVTINGRNVLIGDGQYVEFNRLPIALKDISRVTITRGPNGAAYGDNAFLANIDFETMGPNDAHGSYIRAGGGYNGRSNYGLGTNQQVAGFEVALSASSDHNGGYDYKDTNKTPRYQGEQVDRGQLTISRTFNEHSVWEFNTSTYDSDNKIGTLNQLGIQKNYGAFFELSNKTDIGENSRIDTAISHNHQSELQRQNGCFDPLTVSDWLSAISSPALQGQLQGAIGGVSAALRVPPSNVCFYDDLNVDSQRTDAEVEYESRIGAWRYVAGASTTKIDAKSEGYWDGIEQHQHTGRGFAETSYSVGTLHFSLGGMAQHSDNVDNTQFGDRAAINWTVTPTQSLRYAFTQSFRVPSLIESVTLWHATFCFRRFDQPLGTVDFCQGPPQIITSSIKVKPEHITSNSLGYFGSFLGDALTVDVKVFNDKISDPITSNFFFFSPPPSNGHAFTLRGIETETSLRINPQWSIKGQYSYLHSDAIESFELGMQGSTAESIGVVYRPTNAHTLALSYYGNSQISGNNYSRVDLAYNYVHYFGKNQLKLQLIYQDHITNLDGVSAPGLLGSDEGVFKYTQQFFGNFEIGF